MLYGHLTYAWWAARGVGTPRRYTECRSIALGSGQRMVGVYLSTRRSQADRDNGAYIDADGR